METQVFVRWIAILVNNVVHGLLDMIEVDGFSRLCRDLSLPELGSDFLLLTVFFTHG